MDNPGDLMHLCRLCLVKDQVNIPIFEEHGDIRQIFVKISSCLPVKVSKDDQLPKRICDGCSNKLDLLYEFCNTSANSEKKLLSWLEQAGLKDVDTISAVAQHTAKPLETQTQVKQEALEDIHAAVQQTDHLELTDEGVGAAVFEENAIDESDEPPPPKRARRTAAVKAQINITPDSDDDDDMDISEPMTKVEDESDDSDVDKDPSYVDVPGTSADDQPGPSGVGKDGVEAPNEDVPITTLFQPLKCYICSKTFRNKEQITHHYDNLIVKIVYKCRICNDALSETKYCDHDDEFTGPHCEFCGILIDAPIKFHICFHLNFPQKSDYDGVSRRRNKRRSEVRSPPDDWSEDEYMSKQEYSDWAYDSDTEMCIYCDKVLPAKSLGKHEEWHRNHDYRVKNLKVSQKTKRPSPNDESLCSFCGLFKPNNKIKRHEYVDHTKTKMRKVCDICGIFTCPTYIKEHMRTHDAVQGFKCEECGKAFFRRKALARHRLVHSDVAKWICSDCGKSFKIKFNLRVHMRTHEDVKPFSCSVCKKTFTTKQWRDNHMKTHGIMGQ